MHKPTPMGYLPLILIEKKVNACFNIFHNQIRVEVILARILYYIYTKLKHYDYETTLIASV